MRDDFWFKTLAERSAGATEEELAATQARLGVKLPAAYLEVMRVQNGGYLHCDYYSPLGLPPDSELAESSCYLDAPLVPLDRLVPLLVPSEWGWDIPVTGMDRIIAFILAGEMYWGFDYRQGEPQGEPSILFVDLESDNVEVTVAPDCATLFAHLVTRYPEDDET